MDPVTIIGLLASLSSLIQASSSVVSIIQTYKDGDRDLEDLSNDISVFAEALKGFDRVLRSRQTMPRISGSVTRNALEAAGKTVKDLGTHLQHLSGYEVSVVRRMKWVQNKSSVKKLHERLKEHNAMLQTFVALTHAETFLAVVNQHPQFILLCSSAKEDMLIEGQPIQDSISSQKPQLKPVASSSMLRRHSVTSSVMTDESSTFSMEPLSISSSASSFENSPTSHRQSSDSTATTAISSRLSPAGKRTDAFVSSRNTNTLFQEPSLRASQVSSQDTLVVRQACRYDCYCECHKHQQTGSYKGFPKSKTIKIRCTEKNCRNAITAEDRFLTRSNFFRKALSGVISSKSIKIRYDLNTYRMVSEGSNAMRYVKHGNLEKLETCIASGEATLWDTAPDGWSLLHTAAYNRHLPIVKYLLELGANTEVADVGSRRPADLALFKSLSHDATEVEQDIVELFSQRDDCMSDFEFTPIHIAVLELYDFTDKERPSLETLIQVVDDANNAPIGTDWAKWKLQYRLRSPLFGGIIEYFRASAFEKSNSRKIIHNLLDQKDKKNCWTPLHWAASGGRVDKMKILVDHGADPFLLSNLNANILHAAAESKTDYGLVGALEIWKRCPNRLNINQTNRWAETPLHVAAWCSAACVKLILEVGASPNMKQEDGQVPLHCAGLSGGGPDRREIVSLLCSTESREHINIQDVDGRPPLFDFLDDSECVEILVNHGAQIELVDNSGMTFFHHACIQDESDALRTVFRLNADPLIATKKDCDGNTPLIKALCYQHVDCALVLLELEDIGDIVGNNGWAAIHYAAKIGDVDLLEAVMKHSSFVKGMITAEGRTVDSIAMEAGTWCGKVKYLIRKHNSLA